MTKSEVQTIFSKKYPNGAINFVDNKVLVTFTENGKCYTYQKIAYADLLNNLKCDNYIYQHDYNNYQRQLADLRKCQKNGYIYADDDGWGESTANPETVNYEIEKIERIIKSISNNETIIVF